MQHPQIDDMISLTNKTKIADGVSTTTKWLDTNQMADKEDFERAEKALREIVTPVFKKCERVFDKIK